MKKKITLKSPDDIKRIREAGRIIAEIFKVISCKSLTGVSTLELDKFIEDVIFKAKAKASFKTVKNYAHATCICINDEVVHGIPSKKKIIKKGDIVKIDIGVVKNGYFADACQTFTVKPISDAADKLVSVTDKALQIGIDTCYPGKRLGDLGAAIQEYVESNGFSVVRDYTGHGVGFAVHELPSVLHFGTKGKGRIISEGMVLAIEPMVNEGTSDVVVLGDGWTAVTEDGKLSAQFEHTVAVTKDGPVILTG
ncbi:MAG: type I methionyl aminopeptidase [Spirochaetota bacterium]